MELNQAQIERQDFVDNSIFELLQTLNPTTKVINWNIDFMATVREIIQSRFEELNICNELEFYP